MNASSEIQLDSYIRTALNIITYFEGEERDNLIKELTEAVKQNCVLDEKFKQAKTISDNLIQTYSCIDEGEIKINQVFENYEKEIGAINPDVSQLKTVTEFMKQMQLLCQPETSQSTEDDDEDMAITQDEINVIDPFSKRRMQEPVKNVCGHVYDKESVVAVIGNNPRTRCPISGCKTKDYIDLSKLTIDIVTMAYLKKNTA